MSDQYPEHAKLLAVKDESEAIGTFLDMTEYVLCEGDPEDGRYHETNKSIERVLAEYFGIDLVVLEREKRAMLAGLRAS